MEVKRDIKEIGERVTGMMILPPHEKIFNILECKHNYKIYHCSKIIFIKKAQKK